MENDNYKWNSININMLHIQVILYRKYTYSKQKVKEY